MIAAVQTVQDAQWPIAIFLSVLIVCMTIVICVLARTK